MGATTICLVLWIGAICGETFLFSGLFWFNPNLFFLFPCLLCLHWRGRESIYISTFFGLTADCFSTLPFGIFGLGYLVFFFFIRWYAIKIHRSDVSTLPVLTGVLTLLVNMLVSLLMLVFFDFRQLSWSWMKEIVFYRALATGLLAVPSHLLLLSLEKRLNVRLSERKS